MDVTLSDRQRAWRELGRTLGRSLGEAPSALDTVRAAAQAGILDAGGDLLALSLATEAMAGESASAGIAYALHATVTHAAAGTSGSELAALRAGATVGAMALSSDEAPYLDGDRLRGRASWLVPLTGDGLAVVGAWSSPPATDRAPWGMADAASNDRVACLVRLGGAASRVEPEQTAGLQGLVCGHAAFDGVPCVSLGATPSIMSVARILLAAAGLGMGRRALRESLQTAREYGRTGAGGEQTVQGLLADAATELDAAMMLTWRAATSPTLSLSEASMAKLAATEATQRAVARATQVIGGASFRDGHVIGQLSQDVRALELFAGRTEALREAVARETLPAPD